MVVSCAVKLPYRFFFFFKANYTIFYHVVLALFYFTDPQINDGTCFITQMLKRNVFTFRLFWKKRPCIRYWSWFRIRSSWDLLFSYVL